MATHTTSDGRRVLPLCIEDRNNIGSKTYPRKASVPPRNLRRLNDLACCIHMGTSLPKSSRWDPKNVGQGTLLPSPKQAQYLTIDYQNLGETLRRLALALLASWTLTRRQMTRVRRRLVIHHTQDSRIHGVRAHHGRQLQQALLAVTRPHGVERVVADLRRLQQLPPEANDERLVRRQAV